MSTPSSDSVWSLLCALCININISPPRTRFHTCSIWQGARTLKSRIHTETTNTFQRWPRGAPTESRGLPPLLVRRLACLLNHRVALEAELRREAAQLRRADRAAQRGHAKARERHARLQHLLAVLPRHPALAAPPASLEQRPCASTQRGHVSTLGLSWGLAGA